ncbi:MAG: DUF2470 domain-containing protein [Bacteroidota bacterium]
MEKNLEFKEKFVKMAVDHMNEDHRPEMCTMLKAYCDAHWVTDAEMLHFDKEKVQIQGLGEKGEKETFEITYETPLKKEKEFRPVLVGMVRHSREMLKEEG